MGRALEVRDDLTASELRALAAREKKNRVERRMLAIANALDGMGRAAAARAAGMDRQALRDAVVRYNAEGLDGLYDSPTPGRPPALKEAELALLSARISAVSSTRMNGFSGFRRRGTRWSGWRRSWISSCSGPSSTPRSGAATARRRAVRPTTR